MRFLIRLLINAVALIIAANIVPGIVGPNWANPNGFLAYLAIGLIFGVVNALVRPIITLLTCPLVMLTLGLFTFVINAFMLWLTGQIAQWFGINFQVNGFWAAIVGALIVTVVSILLSIFVPDDRER